MAVEQSASSLSAARRQKGNQASEGRRWQLRGKFPLQVSYSFGTRGGHPPRLEASRAPIYIYRSEIDLVHRTARNLKKMDQWSPDV